MVVVLHHPAGYRSNLAYLLAKAGPLPADEARDGSPLVPGRILVARPGRHLVLQGGRARLLDSAPVNRVKPSIDLLFLSGAREYGPRLVAVVLSGTLNDGSAGLVAARRSGGVAVVQDPHDALFWDMPWNAIDAAGADHCVPLKEMAPLLDRLVRQEPGRDRGGGGGSGDRLGAPSERPAQAWRDSSDIGRSFDGLAISAPPQAR